MKYCSTSIFDVVVGILSLNCLKGGRCRWILSRGEMLFSQNPNWPRSHCRLLRDTSVQKTTKSTQIIAALNKSISRENIIGKWSRNRGKRYIVSCDWLILKRCCSDQRTTSTFQSISFYQKKFDGCTFSTIFLIQGDDIYNLKHVSKI